MIPTLSPDVAPSPYRDLPAPQQIALALRWALLRRGPTAAEFAADVQSLSTVNEESLAAYADSIINSLEFFVKHGYPAGWQWVSWCFQNILNRPTSEADLATFTQQLTAKPKTRGGLAATFVGAEEFTYRQPHLLDVLALYLKFSPNPADEQGVLHWAEQLRGGKSMTEVVAAFSAIR